MDYPVRSTTTKDNEIKTDELLEDLIALLVSGSSIETQQVVSAILVAYKDMDKWYA